jgi:hypothetical protein
VLPLPSCLGELARLEGDYAGARVLLEEAILIARNIGFRAFAAEKLASLSGILSAMPKWVCGPRGIPGTRGPSTSGGPAARVCTAW